MAIVHVAFAIAIKRDADNLMMQKECLVFVSPGLWGFATLLGGVTVAVAYWAIHYSTLRPIPKRDKEEVSNKTDGE